MGGIKRFCLIVFGLSGVLCLCALALPWLGPYQREAAALMDNWYYYLAMQVVLGITGLGVLVALLRGLLTPRRRKTVVIDRPGADRITVSTAAISSQATHVVEADGRLVADKVRVRATRRGNVRVDVRVRPKRTVDVSEEGRRLHDDLMSGLSTICGEKVRRVNLEFVEAELPATIELVDAEVTEVPQSVYDRAGEQAQASADITVPIGRMAPDALAAGAEAADHDAIEGEVE